MSDDEDLRVLNAELGRIVDRLNTMPLARAATVSADCYAVANLVLEQTRALTDEIPAEATLPDLEAHGLGALVNVLGRDYENAAKAAPRADIGPVVDRLVELRRSLP